MKQNALLAVTEHSGAQYNALLKDYADTFKDKNKLLIFVGIRANYIPYTGFLDEPSKKGFKKVQNTVPEYLDYMVKTVGKHYNNLFNIEATNATGQAKARLIVEGEDWGELTTLELLRLRNMLDQKTLWDVYQNLPVRNDNKVWRKSNDEEMPKFTWETDVIEDPNRTTLKEHVILKDENILLMKDQSGYKPVQVVLDKPVLMGMQTRQEFSGEISHRERAGILRRISILKEAVSHALAEANQIPIAASKLTGDKIFSYIHGNF